MTPSSLPSHHDGPLAATQLFRRLVFVLPLIYALSGIRMIHPGEVALAKRFGRWLKSDEGEVVVSQPGLIVALPPPFDEVVRVPLMQEQSIDLLAFWEPPNPVRHGVFGQGCWRLESSLGARVSDVLCL